MVRIEIAYKNDQYFRRISCLEQEQHTVLNRIINKYGTDIYRSVFSFKNETFEEISGPLFFDLDTHALEQDFEDIRRETLYVVHTLEKLFKTDAIQLYFSGTKGFHVILDLGLDFGNSETVISNYKTLTRILQIRWTGADFLDTGIYDSRRVLRVVNTKNSGSGLYKIPLTKNELKDITYKELVSLAKEPRDYMISPFLIAGYKSRDIWNELTKDNGENKSEDIHKRTINISKEQELLPCVKNILETSIGKGSRNNIAVVLASTLLQRDYSIEETKNILDIWNEKNQPPLPDNEINSVIISANSMLTHDKGFGCRRIRELGFCVDSCDINRRYFQ